jgi:hypothetical protein
MKLLERARLTALLLVGSAGFQLARADIYHQFVPLPEESPPMVWFQAQGASLPASSGHAGMLSLGMEAYASPGFPPALWGGWFSWTGEGAYLSYAGGTLSTTDILTPGGAVIPDVRGATCLASALDVMVDGATGDIFAVTLYSGLLFWTPEHLYLLLVGGTPTVYEVTSPAGGPIAGVRGVSRMAAQVIDLDAGPAIDAVLFSGALVYTDSQLFLTRTHSVISTSEILLGGASVPSVRGVLSLGGNANPVALDAGAYVWTRSKVLLYVAGASSYTAEVLDPSGASLSDVWGMTRQGRKWSGSGTFSGAATLFTPARQYFLTTLGTTGVTEVTTGSGAAIHSSVKVVAASTMLHQAGGLYEVLAQRSVTGSLSQRGTVIGLGQ